jgi:hypothetical protein
MVPDLCRIAHEKDGAMCKPKPPVRPVSTAARLRSTIRIIIPAGRSASLHRGRSSRNALCGDFWLAGLDAFRAGRERDDLCARFGQAEFSGLLEEIDRVMARGSERAELPLC